MLQNAHQLNVCELQLLQIVDQPVRKFAVVVKTVAPVRMLHPGTDMTFINCHRLLENILLFTGLHPPAIAPLISGEIGGAGSGSGTKLCRIGEGICLVKLSSFRCIDQVLIELILADSRNKAGPDADLPDLLHGILIFIPAVEGANDMNGCRIRRPYRKEHSFSSIFHGRMCAQLFIDIVMRPLPEEVAVGIGNKYLLLFLRLFLLRSLSLCALRLRSRCLCGGLSPAGSGYGTGHTCGRLCNSVFVAFCCHL